MERISGWTIFSWRGVAVKLHISLVFLIFYVVVVATVQFPFVVQRSGLNPGSVVGAPLMWALLFSMALIVSIIVHEFSHVLMAQHKGYKTKNIVLMMLGGVSQVELPAEKPMDEFKIAIIGPLVSLFLGALLFAIGSITESPSLYFFCYWVGQTNIALGIFNLIPAFPTDGGRVLRAALISKYGRLEGTRKAVSVGHAFAWFFGLWGLLQFNFILVLIAFFIYGGAKSELFIVLGQSLLKDFHVKNLITPIPSISENSTVAEAAQRLLAEKNVFLPTVAANGNYGVISIEDVKKIPKAMWDKTSIHDVQVISPKLFRAEDKLDEVLMYVLANPAGAVPVIENNQVVGVLTSDSIIKTMQLQSLQSMVSPTSAEGRSFTLRPRST